MNGTVEEKQRQAAALPKWRGDYLREQADIRRKGVIKDLLDLDLKYCHPYMHESDASKLEQIRNRLGSMIQMLHEASEFAVFRAGKE